MTHSGATFPWLGDISIEVSVRDIFETALQVGRDARDSYARIGARKEFLNCQHLFDQLASMEEDYVMILEGMAARAAGQNDSRGGNPPETSSAWTGMARMFAGSIQDELKAIFRGGETPREVVEKAIVFERDKLMFFTALQRMLGSSGDRAQVGTIILEELGRIFRLISRLATTK